MVDLSMMDDVLEIRLNRPERRNALGSDDVYDLLSAIPRMERARAVLLYGAPPSFCAGSDLKELAATDVDGMVAHEDLTATLARRFGLLSTPIVAAVSGHALGGGFILAASCDIVVTGTAAVWSLPEVRNGWLPPWGLAALVARTGPVTARRLTWGIDTLDGEEARRVGVADYCVADDDVLERGRAIALQLAELPDDARRSTKLFFQTDMMALAEAWDAEASRIFARNSALPDAQAIFSKYS